MNAKHPQDGSPERAPDTRSLMEVLRARILARSRAATHAVDPGVSANDASQDGPQPAAAGPSPYVPVALDKSRDGDCDVHELLAFDGAMFVRAAYQSVLRREPDPPGFEHYLRELRAGASKAQVLDWLLQSEEGRATGAAINLSRFRALDRIYRLPLLGAAIRAAVSLWNVPRTMRRQRAEQLELFRLLVALRDAAVIDANAVRDAIRSVGDGLQAARTDLKEIEARNGVLRERLAGLDEKVVEGTAPLVAELEGVRSRLETKADRREVTDRTNRLLRIVEARSVEAKLEEHSRRITELARASAQRSDLERFERAQDELRTALDDVRRQGAAAGDVDAKLAALIERIDAAERNWRGTLESERDSVEDVRRILDESKRSSRTESLEGLEAMYASLEERFRGTREEIKERQRIYVPYIREASVAGGSLVVDLGCGRGEWLEVLREEGLAARGVDTNPEFLHACRDSGLDVVQADCLEYLRASAPESAGAVTLFHVIEHLPMGVLIDVLDEARRVLKPGGLLIIETPNPDNLVVGACTFYMDPTHLRPLPSELTCHLFEAKGFKDVTMLPLHPVDADWLHGASDRISLTMNHYFYGAQDYAVIGCKP